MKISDVMTSQPDFCTTNDTVVDCAQLMAQRDVGMVPICESQDTRRLVGCLTDRDIAVRVVAEQKEHATPIADVMSTNVITVRPDEDIEHARALMEEHQIRRLLVTDEHGSLIGVIATADLARSMAEAEVGETLEAISQPAPTLNTK
jgi:CBS domain-containing protein